MASAAQIETNRLNAAASCGLKAPTGKARSSRNHVKYGLFSPKTVSGPKNAPNTPLPY